MMSDLVADGTGPPHLAHRSAKRLRRVPARYRLRWLCSLPAAGDQGGACAGTAPPRPVLLVITPASAGKCCTGPESSQSELPDAYAILL